jgi:hypothetical protein
MRAHSETWPSPGEEPPTQSFHEGDRAPERGQAVRPLHAGESLAGFVTRTDGIWTVEQTAVANGVTADARRPEGFAVKVPIRQRYTPRPPAN